HCAGATRHEKQILIPSVIVDKKFLNLLELSSSGSNSAVECQLPRIFFAFHILRDHTVRCTVYNRKSLWHISTFSNKSKWAIDGSSCPFLGIATAATTGKRFLKEDTSLNGMKGVSANGRQLGSQPPRY